MALHTVAIQWGSQVLGPLVLSRTVRLHPTTVVVALLLGLRLGGALGALLAVPLMGFVQLLFTESYLKSRFYRDG